MSAAAISYDGAVGRWEPNARGRLGEAAVELFRERGYARTTVEEIAARAGLTERTFFRYFADKREVLFSGSAALERAIADAVSAAPETASPLAAVAAGLEAAAALLPLRRKQAKERRSMIAAHAELRERELIKLTSLAAAVAGALRARGVAEPAATLAAEAGIAVFKVAYERWIDDRGPRDLAQHIQASLGVLRAIAAGKGAAPKGKRRLAPRDGLEPPT